jgi:type I restriction enzyme R subunit
MSLGLGLDDVTLGGPSEVGTAGPEPPLVPLSSIITALNERFGTDFTLIDQLVFDQIEEELVANPDLARQAQVNRIDNYKYGFDQAFLTALIGRKSQNEQIFARMLNEPAFAEAVKAQMIGTVYRRQNTQSAASS